MVETREFDAFERTIPELQAAVALTTRGGRNRLTLAYTGDAVTQGQLEDQAAALFPGWDEIEVVRLAD